MAFAIIYTTHSSEVAAQAVSDHLLQMRLIACANIFPITSAYWWQDALQQEGEWVALLKTRLSYWERIEAEIVKIHPYETPCIIKMEVEANAAYEEWIESETNNGQET